MCVLVTEVSLQQKVLITQVLLYLFYESKCIQCLWFDRLVLTDLFDKVHLAADVETHAHHSPDSSVHS